MVTPSGETSLFESNADRVEVRRYRRGFARYVRRRGSLEPTCNGRRPKLEVLQYFWGLNLAAPNGAFVARPGPIPAPPCPSRRLHQHIAGNTSTVDLGTRPVSDLGTRSESVCPRPPPLGP